MKFLVETLLPIILFLGFVSYFLKVYYHFLYLKLLKNYPKNAGFLNIDEFKISYFIDRFETILPFLKKRKKANLKLSNEELKRLEILEKRIILYLVFFLIALITIPLGIYLQNIYS